MKLYVGNYWVPFPSSEYGGTWVVTANSDEEVIKMLSKQESFFLTEYIHLIPEAVAKARVFYLDHVHDHSSEIVDTFFT